MRATLTIEFADGPDREVTAGPADFVAFEDKFGVSALHFQVPDFESFRVQWVYFLAWHALKRIDASTPEFEQWLELPADVSMSQEAHPPTEPETPPAEESPVLQSEPA